MTPSSPELLARYLDVIEDDVVPLTREGVLHGNKLFGAAVLRREDLALVVAGTNNETANPLWHGEIQTINAFYEIDPRRRPRPQDCLFVATHEPCSLCLSGITWSGFDTFAYLFSHEDSRDSFAIPHDIQILKAVYAVPDPDRDTVPADRPLYNRQNEFFTSHDIAAEVRALPAGEERDRLQARIAALGETYSGLSAAYQAGKGNADIPLA
jgi:tRNA(Arg) A34 adenosine deaminase TadA